MDKFEKLNLLKVFTTIVIVCYINFILTSTGFTIEYTQNFLTPQLMSKPIIYDKVSDKGIIAFTIMQHIGNDPDILFSDLPMFSDIGPESIKVDYNRIKEFKLKSTAEVFLHRIPCSIGNENARSYLAYLVRYKNGQSKIAIVPEEDDSEILSEIEKAIASSSIEDVLTKGHFTEYFQEERQIYFFSAADESVRSVIEFLKKINADKIRKELEQIIQSKKLLLIDQPVLMSGGFAVSSSDDKRTRAVSIIGKLISGETQEVQLIEKVFGIFWDYWKEQRTEDFNVEQIDQGPAVKVLVRKLERNFQSISNEGYNNRLGMLRLSNSAYTKMIPVVR